MKLFAPTLFFLLLMISITDFAIGNSNSKTQKQRVLMLTDIENEPDDAQSLVRFLLYSNQWDVEGLIATTSVWLQNKTAAWRIGEIVESYDSIHSQLLKHEPGFPSAEYLKWVIKSGYPGFGMDAVGEGFDSEGSEHIIYVLKKDDDRPVWITMWGGANCLAQALWKLQQTVPAEELNKIVSKIRVYSISDQDNAGPWIRNTFKDLFYIVSPGYQENRADGYFYATWTGISGEHFYRFPSGADQNTVNNNWVNKHIRFHHGPLGTQYPEIEYIMEGDSPSFLFLINNGLGTPDHPDFGSWGGRYELYQPHMQHFFHEPETRSIWTNAKDWIEVDGKLYISEQATIWRWREHYQNDFAARMDWCITSYQEANHPPEVILSHPNEVSLNSGEVLILDASSSTDPDGDNLNYSWFQYREAGSFSGRIKLNEPELARTSVELPNTKKQETIHFIVSVTDHGNPSLTRYQRVIVTIYP